ncbi:TPA: hypothetical protein DCZ46_01745 [Candidatus Campbellbacteria bacterium]|nr:MAG: peptidase M16 domain-containing protein [Candidatus Campbellbacteria bacterium GW2011_OD1_34_28]KKP75199.1 MAG: Peptidase M16 domain protein [Candidatus Campbellbacteria bacterium GW2011_GWD2_35_24]KKP76240.1 MAG: peptidase M16 domain-containing protein [Candidatus Campbellbacteria bacterium GW2011_GWC2_35_28]KKP77429.1 MAG: Peptidase M16 domain protein [Candidatus Campbellbacteria bacterium GW2011_GWC1_35_31]KKP79358.1 MAG: Peptidase M16 domain protein [Candidatus Campbellbacteria bact
MKYKKKILKNGLRIITVPMKDNNTVTALVLVEAGSKYEEKNNNGISHFLEHVCFKGTKNRPNPGDISRELDGLGAETNAFTSHEFTGYYAKAHSKHTHKLIEIISDLYLNPVFNENEINKEKGVIIEEMNMYEDLPMRKVHDVLMNLLYGDQPAGMTIGGDPNFVKIALPKDFIEYRHKHYVASATTVVVAGNINESAVIKDIEKRFENISESKKYKKLKVKESQKDSQIAIKHKKLDQTHLVLAVRAFDTFKKESAVVSVIAGLLGSGMSSRLFTKLREEMGVCYYVRSGNNTFTDHGYLDVSVGSDNKRAKEVITAILEEFKKLKTEIVSEKELKKTKEYLIGGMTLSLESSDSFAEFYGIQDILKETIESPKEKADRIKKVTAGDIKKTANKIFTNANLNLAIVGGVDEKQKQELLKLLKL